MNSFVHAKRLQNMFFQKIYLGLYFPSSENYKEFLEKVYTKLKKRGPKTLLEFKKYAIEEAKKEYTKIKLKKKKKKDIEITILDKDIVKNTLIAIFNFLDIHLKVLNNEYKFERRKNFNNNNLYFETLNKYEGRKAKYLEYTVKSFCENFKFGYELFQKSIFYHIETNNQEIINLINAFNKIGKPKGYAPNKLSMEVIQNTLKTYADNINFIIKNPNKEFNHYIFVIINDIIYNEHGIEEENILAFIEEKNLIENDEVKDKIKMLKEILNKNINIIFNFK